MRSRREPRENRRPREPWDRAALDELRSGQVDGWARAYREAGRITVARSAVETRAALVNDWARADGDKLMIAARRSDVRDLNHRRAQPSACWSSVWSARRRRAAYEREARTGTAGLDRECDAWSQVLTPVPPDRNLGIGR